MGYYRRAAVIIHFSITNAGCAPVQVMINVNNDIDKAFCRCKYLLCTSKPKLPPYQTKTFFKLHFVQQVHCNSVNCTKYKYIATSTVLCTVCCNDAVMFTTFYLFFKYLFSAFNGILHIWERSFFEISNVLFSFI